ncbi:MAG TPA: ABC transporter ATP-binding protein [Actinomycetota bacterium]|nr:ABC transporter ATP-binding protein [Actinomycetota bacterium]
MGMRLLDEKVPWREELRATVRGLGLVARAAPWFVVGVMATTAVQGYVPAVMVEQTGRFLSVMPRAIRLGAESAPGRTAREALIWLGGAILISQVLGPIQQALLFGLQRRFHAYLSQRIMTSVTQLPGLAYFEDPEFRDKLEVSSWVQWAPVQSLNHLTSSIQTLVQLLAMARLASVFAGWIPLLMLATTFPEAVAAWRLVRAAGIRRIRRSDEARKANYFRRLALSLEPAKELRIFGLGDWLLQRQGTHWLAGIREVWQVRRKSLLIRTALHVLTIAGTAYVFTRMISATLDGRIDVGVFTATSMAAIGMTNAFLALSRTLAAMRQANYYLPTALKLMDLPRRDPRLDASGSARTGTAPGSGIVFDRVSFTYPGTERKILDRLDLAIHPATSVALVGENGAGKTTLIKLLCRFYDPDEGRILLDGTDIREYDLVALRSRMAVIFQDFVRYNLSARHNVGFGAVEHMDDEAAVRESARRVGVLDRIEELDNGWDTPLAREFGGVDMSGGEWQRVALARAMMAQIARDSDLLVLDEPTASLDVRLEHELYTHFADLSRGRTTILVSHRFSTVRMADRIVFLENGRVVEDGTHEQLVASRGRYAELYEMQASHYRLTGTLE